jgi:hypothetical protein
MNTGFRASRATAAEMTREQVLPITFSYTA